MNSGHVAVQPCPGGATGFARWSCTNWHGIPSWTPPLPDMSDCSSLWVSHLENRINSGIESVVSLGEELAKNCREKLLYGGDLFRVTDIINQLVSRMEAALEETHNDHNQHVVRELLNVSVMLIMMSSLIYLHAIYFFLCAIVCSGRGQQFIRRQSIGVVDGVVVRRPKECYQFNDARIREDCTSFSGD